MSTDSASDTDNELDQIFDMTSAMDDLLVFLPASDSSVIGVHFIPSRKLTSSVKMFVPLPFLHMSVSMTNKSASYK